MKAPIIDITGKKVGQADLPEAVFGIVPNQAVLAQYLRVYQLRQRQATAKAQTRAEVTGTTAKVWRQKGTGRARHGSRKAPIFVKGGQAHGPSGEQNYMRTISKKVRQLALISALSTRAKDIVVVAGLEKLEPKTKALVTALSKIVEQKQPALTLVLDTPQTNIIRASRNLSDVNITRSNRLNAFEIIHARQLLFTQESLAELNNLVTSMPETASDTKKTATKKS